VSHAAPTNPMARSGAAPGHATGRPRGAARHGWCSAPRSGTERVQAGGLHWNVRRAGAGRRVLLLHGTGASVHTWDGLAPLLASRHELLAPDLPGHGASDPMGEGTSAGPPTPEGMARSLGALLETCDFSPEIIIGHSAGAALALAVGLERSPAPRLVIGLNAALMPYGGVLAPIAQPLARVFASLGPVSRLLAARARQPGTVERLIRGTGSRLPEAGIEAYRALLGREDHVSATLSMMAHWDLAGLGARLGDVPCPLCLIVGDADRTVPPAQSRDTERRVSRCRTVRLPDLGHLAHEERPVAVYEAIVEAERWAGIGDRLSGSGQT